MDKNSNRPLSRYHHLLLVAIIFAILGALFYRGSVIAVMSLFWDIIFYLTYVIAVATVLLTAFWSVLGPGPLWNRTFFAIAISSIVLVGVCIGIAGSDDQFVDAWYFLKIACLVFPAMVIGAQVPFWILRGPFQQQLVYASESPRQTLTLLELFFVIFMFAFMAAVPSFSEKVAYHQLQVGSTTMVYVDEQNVICEPGSTDGYYMQITLTEENLEDARRSQAAGANWTLAVWSYTGGFAVITLIFLPAILLLMKRKRLGLLLAVVYIVTIANIVGVLSFGFSSGGGFLQIPTKVWLTSTFIGLSFALALCVPLLLSRRRGFALRHINAEETVPKEAVSLGLNKV